nr:MAG: hypothetical protein DiTV3a_F17ORF3 [Diabrotica toursvirus 3a]
MVKTPSFEEINFYALDETPPEIIVKKDVDSNFRINQIIKYNEFLIGEISRQENIVLRFKNFDLICFFIEMILVLLDVVSGVLGVFFQDWVISTSSLCILLTAISTSLRNFTKKFMAKIEKHQALLFATKSKFNHAKDKYDLAIRDGVISHEEYVNIVDEYKKYEKLREEIIKTF